MDVNSFSKKHNSFVIIKLTLSVCLISLVGFHFILPKVETYLTYRIQADELKVVNESVLDNCQYIYIDIGTNIGVQIRKLYELHLYPKADV